MNTQAIQTASMLEECWTVTTPDGKTLLPVPSESYLHHEDTYFAPCGCEIVLFPEIDGYDNVYSVVRDGNICKDHMEFVYRNYPYLDSLPPYHWEKEEDTARRNRAELAKLLFSNGDVVFYTEYFISKR